MNVNIQDTLLNNLFSEKTESASGILRGPREKEERKTVFAGDLNLDPIAEKRKQAQQKAKKIMQDAWAQEQSVTDMIKKREDHYAKMRDEVKALNDEIGGLNDEMNALSETYDVDADSEEQKDLELLMKREEIQAGLKSPGSLTEEEKTRLAQLDAEPLTEYQERALTIYKRICVQTANKNDYENKMKDDMANIREIEKNVLAQKRTPMQNAQEEIGEIYDQLSDEITGMLRQEGMEHLDELQKENEEKAEKAEEEQEKTEKEQAELREKRAIEEALRTGSEEAVEKAEAIHRQNEAELDPELDSAIDYDSLSQAVQDASASIDELRASMNLVEADLKGLQVDEEV